MRMPLIDRSSTAPVLPYRSKKNFCSREKPGFLRRLSDSFSNCVKEGNKLHTDLDSESFPLLPAVQHSKQTHPELMSSFFGRRSASIVREPEKNESDEERRGSVYRAVRDFSSGENHDQKATACWKDYVFSPSRLICKNAEHLPQSNRPKRKSRDINFRFFNGKQTKSNLKIKRSKTTCITFNNYSLEEPNSRNSLVKSEHHLERSRAQLILDFDRQEVDSESHSKFYKDFFPALSIDNKKF